MDDIYMINENTRIIGTDEICYLAVNDPNVAFDDYNQEAILIDKNGNIMGHVPMIGIVTKRGYWHPLDCIITEIIPVLIKEI